MVFGGEKVRGLLLWSTVWYAAGLGLFASGFFLSRIELEHRSSCDATPAPPLPFVHPAALAAAAAAATATASASAPPQGGDNDMHPTCWGTPRRWRRMVLVVIDALRFDFVYSPPGEEANLFHRHLPIIGATMRRDASRSLLYQFEATPPTVTAQRLKGLSTGGLPTFMDISKNFASAEVHADNIVAQLAAAGRRVVFMGDDTWEKLFPPALHFTRSTPFPSFNVKDLHTVDDGCVHKLTGRHERPEAVAAMEMGKEAASTKPELERDDWDVVIAHFLGVDHVGHRFGPNHPAMRDKLEQMNIVLSDVIEMIDEGENDTLLVVIGDHGMTPDGNHGGASKLERRSALFMYSGGKNAPSFRGVGGVSGDEAEVREKEEEETMPRVVPQVDLLPTLALVLGVPIPFGSLGQVLPELFAPAHGELHRALSLNAAQVWEYLSAYIAISPTFPASAVRRLKEQYDEALRAGAAIEAAVAEGQSGAWLDAARARASALLQEFLHSALSMCRDRWASFDLPTMAVGGAVVALAVLVAIAELIGAVVRGPNGTGTAAAPPNRNRNRNAWLLGAGAVSALLGAGAFALLTAAESAAELVSPAVAGFALGSAATAAVDASVRCAAALRAAIASGAALEGGVDAAAFALAALGAVVCRCLGLLSNSYIEAEHVTVPFLIVSIALVAGLLLLYRGNGSGAAAALLCAIAARGATALLETRRSAGMVLESSDQFEHPTVALGCDEVASVLHSYLPLATLFVLCATQASPDARVHERVIALAAYALVGAHWWGGSSSGDWFLLGAPRVAVALVAVAAVSGFARSRQPGRPWLVLLLVAVPLTLCLGPQSPFTLLLVAVQLASLDAMRRALGGGALAALGSALTSALLAQHAFFTLGHHTRFSALQHSCGFVGLAGFHPLVSPALVVLNTIGGHLMALLPLGAAAGEKRRVTFGAVSLAFGTSALVTAAFVAAERRHLMVWAVFAPKLVFEAGLCVFAHLALLLAAAL